jgi:hypothetical protein
MLLSQLGVAMSAEDRAQDQQPPLAPEAEMVTADVAFSENCLATVNDFIAKSNGRLQWELGRPLVTRSDKWGLIWRVDFNDGGPDLAPYISRIVCWKTPGTDKLNIEVAVFNTPPLDEYFKPGNGTLP